MVQVVSQDMFRCSFLHVVHRLEPSVTQEIHCCSYDFALYLGSSITLVAQILTQSYNTCSKTARVIRIIIVLYMFKAVFEEPLLFKRAMECIKEYSNLVNITITQDGLSVHTLDKSHTSLICLKLNRSGFTDFRITKPCVIGINVENLTKIMKCSNDDDSMKLQYSEESPKLNITFQSKTGDKIIAYDLNLISIDSEELGLPETDYQSQVVMSSAEFAKTCKDFQSLAKSMQIQINKQHVKMTFHSEEGSGSVLLRQKSSGRNEEKVQIKVIEPAKAEYSMLYLSKTIKAAYLSRNVRICVSKMNPILVQYYFPKMAGHLEYFVAPIINDMDEQR